MQFVDWNFISLNERGKFMKEKLSKSNNKKRLSKEQQVKMLEFFAKTSIPRKLQPSREQR